MQLIDRKRLARLMVIQRVSQRQLAAAAGYDAHSYVTRLLNGTVTTLKVEPAVRIAEFLQVDVGDLFVPRSSTTSGPNGKRIAA